MKLPKKKSAWIVILLILIVLLAAVLASLKLAKNKNTEDKTEFVCGSPVRGPEKMAISDPKTVKDFVTCHLGGFDTDQAFPRRTCKLPDGQSFSENITDPDYTPGTSVADLTSLKANDKITFPVDLKGEADESWFIYGGFPINLVSVKGGYANGDYTVISSGIACPNGEKNDSGKIPFTATLAGPTAPVDGQLYISLINNDPLEIGQKKIIRSFPVQIR